MDPDILRIHYTFWSVIAALVAVVIILLIATVANDTDQAAKVAVAALGLIGTLVGFISGHNTGAVGKEKAEERARIAEQKSAALRAYIPDTEFEKAKASNPKVFTE